MTECRTNMGMIPLSKVVYASIIDSYGDINRTEQRYSHWAARGLKKLYQESLRLPNKRVLLNVNKNTHTATLPIDFDYETFVGYIENGQRNRISNNPDLINEATIEGIEGEQCSVCNQSKGICEDLNVTETTDAILINDNTYYETTTKTLYPNGNYYLEKSTPFLNVETEEIEYRTTKEYITNIDLLACGCPAKTEANKQTLSEHCAEVFNCYYTACGCGERSVGGYKIFKETGLIQVEYYYPYDQIYLEYNGFLPKVGGQYMVPEQAFEALVEWTKFKAIQGKQNITTYEKNWQLQQFIRERRNMERFKVPLSAIIDTLNSLPVFDLSGNTNNRRQVARPTYSVPATPRNVSKCESIATTPSTGGQTIINNNNITIVNKADYTIAVKVGEGADSPILGQTTYQNDLLIGATGITYILVAKQIETVKDGDFTFNATTGTIDRTPNVWVTGDTLIINYNKD